MYDLFKVMFARSNVMLREHFRCVAPIIEYSKREFHNMNSGRFACPEPSGLDPLLIDVLVEDGCRKGDLNLAKVRFIVEQIKRIVSDQTMADRTIGVVSQARFCAHLRWRTCGVGALQKVQNSHLVTSEEIVAFPVALRRQTGDSAAVRIPT
jgi:hypothetical protein